MTTEVGGGGVAIWVKDSIVSRERGDIVEDDIVEEGINVEDSVWVEIRDCKNSKILVGCFIGLRVGRKRRKEEYMKNSKGHAVREEY